MKPKHNSALTISWWLKQLCAIYKQKNNKYHLKFLHYLSFKQEYAALKCTPNEQNKQTNKQAQKSHKNLSYQL